MIIRKSRAYETRTLERIGRLAEIRSEIVHSFLGQDYMEAGLVCQGKYGTQYIVDKTMPCRIGGLFSLSVNEPLFFK